MADDLQDDDLQFMMDEDMTCGGATTSKVRLSELSASRRSMIRQK